MRPRSGLLVLLGTFFQLVLLASAQTITTTDVAGNTIVEVVTTDPIQEIPITTTIETIPAGEEATTTTSPTTTSTSPTTTTTSPLTTTTTSPTTTTTEDDQQQGPVAQPATTETGLTTFRYTTTNAAGATVVLTDTFTPSFAPTDTTPAAPTFVGTVLSYDQWLSLVGSNTVPVTNAAIERWKIPRSVLSVSAAMLASAMGGVWLVIG